MKEGLEIRVRISNWKAKHKIALSVVKRQRDGHLKVYWGIMGMEDSVFSSVPLVGRVVSYVYAVVALK